MALTYLKETFKAAAESYLKPPPKTSYYIDAFLKVLTRNAQKTKQKKRTKKAAKSSLKRKTKKLVKEKDVREKEEELENMTEDHYKKRQFSTL